MQKIKPGDFVKVKVASVDGRKKLVDASYEGVYEIKEFEVIASYQVHKEISPCYMVIVDLDMIGWTVSKSHMLYYDLNEKYLNLKFYDINQDFLITDAISS